MTTRNQRDLDNLLAEGGGELGALYGRLSKAQPPRRLDRQILAEASRAVHGRPKGARWLLGFGTAAGVLLAAGIAWRVNTDLVRQREGMNVSAPAAVAPPAAPVVEVIPIQARELSKSRASAAPLISSKGFDGASESVVTGSRIATPPLEATRNAAAAPRQKAEAAERSAEAESAGADAPAAPPRVEPEAFAPPPPPPAPAAMATQADADAAAVDIEVMQKQAPAPAPLARQSASAAAAADVAALAKQRDEAKAALPDDGNTHDAAIARIRALLAANRREEALAALRELRRQQPTLVLPDDLSALER